MNRLEPAIIVHGGAGRWSIVFELAEEKGLDITEETVIDGVRDAAMAGYKVLKTGGSAVDAVTEAIAVMEGSGIFNAGVASALSASGEILMDAGIMDGSTRLAIGVLCLKYPKHPIRLARILLGKTSHTILGCEYADRLAEKYGLEKHPGPHPRAIAMHEWAKKMLEENREETYTANKELLEKLGLIADTVGAVAIDKKGNIAAGVSTGGTNYKIPGRIGDSPIPGAGYYALNNVGGAAATGLGEAIILTSLTTRIINNLEEGQDPYTAGRKALETLEKLTGGKAGAIILDKNGQHAAVYNTEAMPWALVKNNNIETGLWQNKTSIQ